MLVDQPAVVDHHHAGDLLEAAIGHLVVETGERGDGPAEFARVGDWPAIGGGRRRLVLARRYGKGGGKDQGNEGATHDGSSMEGAPSGLRGVVKRLKSL